MHDGMKRWLESLSFGKKEEAEQDEAGRGVGNLARIYETARNALEYRADHLVRRAAVERIWRREAVFGSEAGAIAARLGQELVWAGYVTEAAWRRERMELVGIVEKYLKAGRMTQAPGDFVLMVASAEIEEKLNPNPDYQMFTGLAFRTIRERVRIEDGRDEELILFAAIETAYAQMDEAGMAYHLFRLLKEQGGEEVAGQPDGGLGVAYEYWQKVRRHPRLNATSAVVRRLDGPLNLIRDMYFSDPGGFRRAVSGKTVFDGAAKKTLLEQLQKSNERIGRATARSILYVFLTKMLLGVVVEIPIESLTSGRINPLALGLNLTVPVFLMWLLTLGIRTPSERELKRLLAEAWRIMSGDGGGVDQEEVFVIRKPRWRWSGIAFWAGYGTLFVVMFAGVYQVLKWVGFSWVSMMVFGFFLSVVTFFAYRIRQSAQVYAFRPRTDTRVSLGEALVLPMVAVGGAVSREVARFNFLVFIFDFALEMPFKSILRFFDSWAHFLATKQDEVVG
ncbi:hypothetical protein HYS82_03835 [Candidatus Amesbacteria bacterium]|nr:hypothetical protein [Candidatus Amesbacteria bacterium]